MGAGPLRRRIRRRDKLRLYLAGRAEGSIVERCQILANRSSGIGVEAADPPLIAGNRPLLVGVGRDQARIHREAFAADEALAQAPLHHRLEQMPQDIALPEPAMTVA